MKNIMFYFGIFLSCSALVANEELPFVIVVPSYKNEQWVEANINSILDQNYSNYRVIYINDCSPDNTMQKLYEVLTRRNAFEKFTIVDNKERCLAMANLYNAIHTCHDDEIVVLLDGDDWFPDGGDVLSYLNEVYRSDEVWLTYGEFLVHQRNSRGFSQSFAPDIVKRNLFRKAPGHLPISHLKTFYTWLFKRIKLKDFVYEGDFFKMTYDKAIMAPLIEMAAHRYKCIDKILYIYNESNPINDFKVDMKLQHFLCDYILKKTPYQPLSKKKTIADEVEEKTYKTVIITNEMKRNQSQLILPLIEAESAYYIVLADPYANLNEEQLKKHITYLELTGALTLKLASVDLQLRGMKLSIGATAWQHQYASSTAKQLFNNYVTIIRKQDLIRLIRSNRRMPFCEIEADDTQNVSLVCEI